MDLNTNRRNYNRTNDELPIIYEYFGNNNSTSGQMHNYCADGMYFETESALLPGSDICIKEKNYQLHDAIPEIYAGFSAEVMWCKKMTIGTEVRFGIGVQYYDTFIH